MLALWSGFLASEDSARVLFQGCQKGLVTQRAAGMLVAAEDFQFLLPNHADQQAAPVGGHSEQRSNPYQRIGPDLDLLGTTELGHGLQVARVVLFAEQRLLPTVSSPGDVMRNAGSKDGCQASHRRKRPRPGSRGKCQVRCSRNSEREAEARTRYGVPGIRYGVPGPPELGMVSPEPQRRL